LIPVAAAFVVIAAWFGMIGGSLWLDETGTWWIVKDGPGMAVQRALSWSGQSPLYYLVAWLSSRLLGLNEIGLRLPSVLAMAGAVYFLFRIAEKLLDLTAAITAAFVFLCAASFYAVDARPYALALLCLTASTFFLLRWVDRARTIDAILYVSASALLVYAHVVLSVTLAAGIAYAVMTLRREPRRLVRFAGMPLVIALMCIPILGELRAFYAHRGTHTFTAAPSLENLLPALIPGGLAGGVVILAWLGMAFRREASAAGECTRDAGFLIGIWSLLAPLTLFLLAFFTDIRLFVPKYYCAALPGQALLVGRLLSSIDRRAVRNALCIAVAGIALLTSGKLAGKTHGNEDWRDALSFVRGEASSAPVLVVSGFVEASDFKVITDPGMRDVLFAPESLYGVPARSVRLPNAFSGASNPDMERIARELRPEKRFFLVTENPDRSYEMWLLGAMQADGARCKSQTTGNRFGYLWVTRFECE
jgi:mannosyltransferase